MAQELVLVPKAKYEHLLQQVESKKSAEDPTSSTIENSTDVTDKSESDNKGEHKVDETSELVAKNNLYVRRPLSDFEFLRKETKRRKQHNVKRNTDVKDTQLGKNKWINYIV